jgi:transposase
LLRLWDCLWTFIQVEGVEPTNDAAERALRHAVIWCRISGGTVSEVGSRFVERLLTAVATCRQRGLDVLGDLTTCLRARLDGSPAPPLWAWALHRAPSRPATAANESSKTSRDPGRLGYRPQASVMQRQRQARPWAQATRRENQRAARRIPEQAFDAGPLVVRVEEGDQYPTRANAMASGRGAAAVPPQPWLITIVGSLSASRPTGAKTSAAMRVPSLTMSAARQVTSSGTGKSGLRSCADAADSAGTSRVRAANRKRLGNIGNPRE